MADTWHYVIDGKQQDPTNTEGIRRLLSAGKLKATDLVWKDGMADWTPIRALKEFADAVPAVGAASKSTTASQPNAAKPPAKTSAIAPAKSPNPATADSRNVASSTKRSLRADDDSEEDDDRPRRRRDRDDDEDDRPRRRKKKPESSAAMTALKVGGGVVATVVVGLFVFFVTSALMKRGPERDPLAGLPPEAKKPANGVPPPVIPPNMGDGGFLNPQPAKKIPTFPIAKAVPGVDPRPERKAPTAPMAAAPTDLYGSLEGEKYIPADDSLEDAVLRPRKTDATFKLSNVRIEKDAKTGGDVVVINYDRVSTGFPGAVAVLQPADKAKATGRFGTVGIKGKGTLRIPASGKHPFAKAGTFPKDLEIFLVREEFGFGLRPVYFRLSNSVVLGKVDETTRTRDWSRAEYDRIARMAGKTPPVQPDVDPEP